MAASSGANPYTSIAAGITALAACGSAEDDLVPMGEPLMGKIARRTRDE